MTYMSGKSAKAERRKQSTAPVARDLLDTTMLSDDVSLVTSLAMSAEDSAWAETVGLAVAPQVARVLHEGVDHLQRIRPDATKALAEGWETDIAVARHTVKLLDDNKKTVDSIVDEFTTIGSKQRTEFDSDDDYAFLESDGRAMATARLASYQSLVRLEDRFAGPGAGHSYNFSRSMGGRLVALQQAFGRSNLAIHVLPLPLTPRPTLVGMSSTEFAAGSYDPSFPDGAKDVTMFVECSVNAALHVFAPAERPLSGSLFRIRFVAASHAINALTQLLGRYPSAQSSPGRREVETVAGSNLARFVVSLRALRNRSMHYGVPATYVGMSAKLPAYGLVEAATGGEHTYREIEAMTSTLLTNMSDALRSWRYG